MAKDPDFINEQAFNSFFKNSMRDMFVYQFKKKDRDFFDKGNQALPRRFAGAMLCHKYGLSPERLLALKMGDIQLGNDTVTLWSTEEQAQAVEVTQPLCQMVKFLMLPDPNAFFLVGYNSKPDAKEFEETIQCFKDECHPKTDEAMYAYWSERYLESVNTPMKSGKLYNVQECLKKKIEQMSGVQWKNGDDVDLTNSRVGKPNGDTTVQCVTADPRTLTVNPFHSLYRYCNACDGLSYVFVLFAVLLYFQMHITVERREDAPEAERRPAPKAKWEDELDYLFDDVKDALPKPIRNGWDTMSADEKIFALHSELKQVLKADKAYQAFAEYLQQYKKTLKLDLDAEAYVMENSTSDRASVQTLHAFYRSVVERSAASSGKPVELRRFRYILDELVEIGLVEKETEWCLTFKNAPTEGVDRARQLAKWLSACGLSDATVKEAFKNREFLIYTDTAASKERLKRLRETAEKTETITVTETESIRIAPTVRLRELTDAKAEDVLWRFSQMVGFFSQTAVLGEVGAFLADELALCGNDPTVNLQPITFKHNYLIRSLNDYNLISLLYAVKNSCWVTLEYRDAVQGQRFRRWCVYPMEIRENVSNGQQVLVCYHPRYRSVTSLRVDFIDSIMLGSPAVLPPFFEDDKRRAKTLIAHTWGDRFDRFFEGNVKGPIKPSRITVSIQVDRDEQSFMYRRLVREIGEPTEQSVNGIRCLTVTAEVVNPMDVVEWVKTFTKRIVKVDIAYHGILDDTVRAFEDYVLPVCDEVSLNLDSDATGWIEPTAEAFTEQPSYSTQVFNKFYSQKTRQLGEILRRMMTQTPDADFVKSEITTYKGIFAYGTQSNRRAEAKSFIEAFLIAAPHDACEFYAIEPSTFSGVNHDRPLTYLEAQWLQTILSHPLASCFLEMDEVSSMQARLPKATWFDWSDCKTVGGFFDLDSFYGDPQNGENLIKIFRALQKQRTVSIGYGGQNKTTEYRSCRVAYIEYSKRENRFRIRAFKADGQPIIFNYERIQSVSDGGEAYDVRAAREELRRLRKTASLEILFDDVQDLLNRLLTEFSCYEKSCVQWGFKRYKMRLYYDTEDAFEMAMRLLAYGSLIKICSDSTGSVMRQLREHCEKQLELFEAVYEAEKETDRHIKGEGIER